MVVRRLAVHRWWVGLLILLAACAPRYETSVKIVLLAPFEGRYREVGYNALYAARLALADAGVSHIELLPLDDGGTITTAADRIRGLSYDPAVRAVIGVGYAVANGQTQQASDDVPMILVGYWGAQPEADSVFMLASSELDSQVAGISQIEITDAAALNAPIVGGDVFALAQFPLLQPSLVGVVVLSSGSLPDSDFRDRYMTSDLFVPEPGLLATLTYDAVRMTAQAIGNGVTRPEVTENLQSITYTGINGDIRFEGGFWVDAPINRFVYNENGQLIPANDIIE